jgi:hypothetical protein
MAALPTDPSNSLSALPIYNATPLTFVNGSAKITTAATAQLLLAAAPKRRYLYIQNPLTLTDQGIAAAEPLYVDITSSFATGNCIALQPGASLLFDCASGVPINSIYIKAATVNHNFVCYYA